MLAGCKAENKFEGHRHEDATCPEIQDAKDRQGDERLAICDFDGSGDSHRKAEESEPQVFGMMTLGQVEGGSQCCDTEEKKADDHDSDYMLIPVAFYRKIQPVVDVVESAKFDICEQPAPDGRVRAGPSTNSQQDCAVGRERESSAR